MKNWDAIVVGGGPAGLTAGFHLARAGWKTLLLERERFGGKLGRIPTVYNYPGFPKGIAGSDLSQRLTLQAQSWGLEAITREARCVKAGKKGWSVHLDDSASLNTRTVILATGTEFLRLHVPGEAALADRGVFHAVFDDAPRFSQRRVGVVGGGETAAHQALALAEHAEKVILFVRGTQIKAIAPLRQRVSHHPRIELRFRAQIKAIEGTKSLTGVRWGPPELQGKTRHEALHSLFILIGQRPLHPDVPGMCPLTPPPGIFFAGDARFGAARQSAAAAADGLEKAMACDTFLQL